MSTGPHRDATEPATCAAPSGVVRSAVRYTTPSAGCSGSDRAAAIASTPRLLQRLHHRRPDALGAARDQRTPARQLKIERHAVISSEAISAPSRQKR